MKELIEKIDFFSGLEDKILRKVANACIMRQFTRNEIIVRQGEMGLGLYVISKGRVKIEREQKGGARMQVAELGPEQFFGEMSIVDNKPRSATVTAAEDSECLLLTRDSFVKLMNRYPEIPIRLTRVLAERLRVANEKMSSPPSPNVKPPAPPTAAGAQPQAAPPAAVPVSSNGASPGSGKKSEIQQMLLDTFSSLYTLKAMTRFSVAVLGCPVEGSAANLVAEVRAGDVKAFFFPAGEAVDMRIQAFAPGSFTLNVFTPSAAVAFGPQEIAPADDVRMLLDPSGVRLSRRGA
ncbi:MAG: cyclic nucleotide-binding domain-containing protein [Bryobacteraceae bacterium]